MGRGNVRTFIWAAISSTIRPVAGKFVYKTYAQALSELLRRNGFPRTVAQAEAGCTVFGMPKAAIEREAAQQVLTLPEIAALLGQTLTVPGRRS